MENELWNKINSGLPRLVVEALEPKNVRHLTSDMVEAAFESDEMWVRRRCLALYKKLTPDALRRVYAKRPDEVAESLIFERPDEAWILAFLAHHPERPQKDGAIRPPSVRSQALGRLVEWFQRKPGPLLHLIEENQTMLVDRPHWKPLPPEEQAEFNRKAQERIEYLTSQPSAKE